jgi:hypothetical protein
VNKQDRIADPGFTAAMTVVNRAYSTGLDRGLYLGLRRMADAPATN